MTATMNGKPRKQLSDELSRLEAQLDRHDTILDALSEGLAGAVKDAATDGTRMAVKDAVVEILTDPALRAALHAASAPPAGPRRETGWDRLKARVRAAADKAKAKMASAVAAIRGRVEAARAKAAGVGTAVRVAWRLKTVALVAVGVGAVVAGVAYVAGHGVAAAPSGVGATVTQAGLWARRAARRLVTA